jgi:hypothetical protein
MVETLHITSGDIAGGSLAQSGLPGEVFVWHDILYDGPRCLGWPDEETLNARAVFLEECTAGGLERRRVLETLHNQYRKLTEAGADKHIVLWFASACLISPCSPISSPACSIKVPEVWSFSVLTPSPESNRFTGSGRCDPINWLPGMAIASPSLPPSSDLLFKWTKPDTTKKTGVLTELSQATNAPLPWIPAAVTRWLQERPDPVTGLGRLEELALKSIRAGCETPGTIFTFVAAADTPPLFWGDTTLWAKINGLAAREPPLVRIDGPADRLPQWESEVSLSDFTIMPVP